MTVSEPREYRGADLKLFVKDLSQGGRKRTLTVKSWSTVKDVKDLIHRAADLPCNRQKLFFGPLLSTGCELPNHRSLHDVGIHRSGETLFLEVKQMHNSASHSSLVSLHRSQMRDSHDISISSSMVDTAPSQIKSLIQVARRGLDRGLKPELVMDGSGGTYYMHDPRKAKVAVFKPADEEPYAKNNPRGYLQQPGGGMALREGIVPGEACIREVAAYLLDHRGFSSVPMTTLAEARHPAFNTNGARFTVAEGGAAMGLHSTLSHTSLSSASSSSALESKAGSFQEFVHCECTMDDISPSKLSTEQVHKIAILDIRLMNADRNAANLLCRRLPDNTLELVPIDHGYCLRSVCDVAWYDWCWLDWAQLKEPLSEASRKYILNLDIEADAKILHDRLNICEKAIDNFRASSLILKAGVKAGLSLYEIAVLCCRNDSMGEIPSRLEVLSKMASEIAQRAIENDRFHLSAASRALVDQLSPSQAASVRIERSANRLHKSMSSAEFGSFRRTKESLEEEEEEDCESPGMAPSTSSDSSSESSGEDNDEKDTCNEWAKCVIQDVSMDLPPTVTRPQRSASLFSDDGSTDSPGFWKVNPGDSVCFSEDGSGFWSPQSSPKATYRVQTPPPELTLPMVCKEPFGGKPRVSFTFADSDSNDVFVPRTSVDTPSLRDPPPFPSVVRTDSGMTRSKSYSALSSMSFDKSESSLGKVIDRTPGPDSKDYEIFRKTFLTFIDFMMVREVTMTANHRTTTPVS